MRIIIRYITAGALCFGSLLWLDESFAGNWFFPTLRAPLVFELCLLALVVVSSYCPTVQVKER